MADEQTTQIDAEEHARLKSEYEAMKGRNSEYERMLLDPTYLEWLASGKGGGRQELQQRAKESAPEVNFDQMSNTDLVEYLQRWGRGEINRVFTPMKQESDIKDMVSQVKECEKEFADFKDFKAEMIAIGRRHPNITAREAYFQAKGAASVAPKKPAPRTEMPGGGASTKKAEPKGFDGAFAAAWEQAGLGANRGEG